MQMNTTKLRVLRAEKNWTQGEVARRAKLSQNSYSRIERGLQFPKYPTLEAIAAAYGLTIGDLVKSESTD